MPSGNPKRKSEADAASLRRLRETVNDLREEVPDALDEELADIECVLGACADALEADELSQSAINERALGGGGS